MMIKNDLLSIYYYCKKSWSLYSKRTELRGGGIWMERSTYLILGTKKGITKEMATGYLLIKERKLNPFRM